MPDPKDALDRLLIRKDDYDQLLARLKAAEDACLVYGWTSLDDRSVRSKALYMLWSRWLGLVPEGFEAPQAHPDLSDEALAELAAARDEIRERTLRALRDGR